MERLAQPWIITSITVAVFVPSGTGNPVHQNRPTHGFAFSHNCTTVYRFQDGPVLSCGPGQCIYLPKGSNYTVQCTVSEPEGAGVYAINFHLAGGQDGTQPFLLRVKGRDEVRAAFARAQHAWRNKPAGFYEECLSDLYRLLRIFKREAADYVPQDTVRKKLLPALQHIELHYTTQSIALEELARICGVSQPYLRRLFKAAFGVSPSVYIRNLRINYAKELLRSGEYSVTSAALLAGFNDAAYFSREFKKATGVSPNHYCPD